MPFPAPGNFHFIHPRPYAACLVGKASRKEDSSTYLALNGLLPYRFLEIYPLDNQVESFQE